MALSRKKPCEELSKLEKILISIDGRYTPLLILALEKNHRFSDLLRRLPEANKQSLSTALKQLIKYEIVFKDVIKESAPQHIEYGLTEKGKRVRGVLLQMSEIL